MSKDDIAPIKFYADELKGAMFTYDVSRHKKDDIKVTVEVWRNDLAVLSSLVNELMEK